MLVQALHAAVACEWNRNPPALSLEVTRPVAEVHGVPRAAVLGELPWKWDRERVAGRHQQHARRGGEPGQGPADQAWHLPRAGGGQDHDDHQAGASTGQRDGLLGDEQLRAAVSRPSQIRVRTGRPRWSPA